MLQTILDKQIIDKLTKTLLDAKNVVVTCHMSPDGDAIGATNAFYFLLKGMGKNVKVITPDQAPYDLAFIPGYDDMVSYTRHATKAQILINNADLILCLDYNGLKRISNMGPFVKKASATKVLIDHHLHPEDFCDIVISHPEMTSTCELIYRVICELNWLDKVDQQVAECLYTGMMTDTGNFSYNSNHSELYLMVADLVDRGVNKDRIYKLACNTSSETRMRLTGYAIAEKMELFPEHKASLIVLTKEDLDRFHYQSGDTETLANMPLAIPQVIWSTFFRQEVGYVKVSMRSEGDFAVNTLCQQYFNGGGHANAAGGEFKGTMEEAVATYHKVLNDLSQN